MRYQVFLVSLLLLVMVTLPFLVRPDAENTLNMPPAGASAPPEPLGADPSPPPSSEAGRTGSAPSRPQPSPLPGASSADDRPPVSKIVSMKDPVLLLDKATGQVVTMSQQAYVLGAVCSEMPAKFHPEALKAQAVAAHSYVLRCREQERRSPNAELKGAYLAVDTAKRSGYVGEAAARELYGDKFDLYYPAIREAVEQVADEILVYDGEPIVAAYHAISAGRTENASNVWTGSADYLVPVDSPGDRLAPDFETTETFTLKEAQDRLKTAYPDIALPEDPAAWFSDAQRSASGYITSLRIGGTQVPGQTLRNLFEQRSSCLDISYRDGVFTFSARGYGHGIGMSQYGADYMARQGADYREILAHYYAGAQLVRLQ